MQLYGFYALKIVLILVAMLIGIFLFRKKIGRRLLAGILLLVGWFGIFALFLSQEMKPVYEQVVFTALADHEERALSTDVGIAGYNIGGEMVKLGNPLSGLWAEIGDETTVERAYFWYDESLDKHPAGGTRDLTLEIPIGRDRTILFHGNCWSGLVSVDYAGEHYIVNTYAASEGMTRISFPVSNSSNNAMVIQQKQQLPFFVGILLIMTAVLYGALGLLMEKSSVKKFEKHQFLFRELVKRDFTLKYKRTILGVVWSAISPLVMLLVMWLVFNKLLGTTIAHFPIYMFVGQLIFNYFSDATNQGMTSLIDNASIFTKINIPKYLFLISKNLSSLINFGITLGILLAFVAIDGLPFTWKYLMLIYPIFFLIMFNIGLGLILSALFVFFRDMQYLWGIFTQLLMWTSAIFYSIDGFSSETRNFFLLNPIYLFIRYFRKIIIDCSIPSLGFHLLMAGYALLLILIGSWVYKKYNHEFLYYV